MNTNKKWNRGLAICLAASALLSSCAKFDEDQDFYADKPQSLIDQEARDAYNTLNTYVDYAGQPNFKLGAELELPDLTNYSLLYQVVNTHFNEISLTRGQLNHMTYVNANGTINVDSLRNAIEGNTEKNKMSIHAGHLVKHENQQAAYLNALIADIIIPGVNGVHLAKDFENQTLGTQPFPMSSGGSGTIANDPRNESGKVLQIIGAQTHPRFEVNLPEGVKLGDCKIVTMDFYGTGSTGLYGSGMRMGISATATIPSLTVFGSPSSFGCPDGAWGRGRIRLPIANLNLTEAQKQLTTFYLTTGSGTGSANYYLDNIKIEWEQVGGIIVKTAEEKKEIYTNELDKWIRSVAFVADGKINSWSVIYQPIDETDPTKLRTGVGTATLPANTFYWQDYLGKDYAATAISKIREYANATDKVFFTETNLINNPAKIQGLVDLITYTEGKGQRVDGIATEMALNPDMNKSNVENTLRLLAATGKLIKISALDIGIGGPISIGTPILYQQQADNYKWFVKAYYSLIPPAQRAGITFRSLVDRVSDQVHGWRINEPVGIFTNNKGYERKPAYVGLLEAFQGK